MRDHISKPRPESSLSQMDDFWSESGRPFSSLDALTDDTSIDAAFSGGTPDRDGSIKEVLENQRQEFESRLQAISESTEAEDLKAEKHQMEHQLKLIQTQMKRIIDARARGEEIDTEAFEPVMYSARQLKLIRKVLDKWRAHRSFSMAEVVLSNAVVMKEANVIRYELLSRLLLEWTNGETARNWEKMYPTTSLSLQEVPWRSPLHQWTLSRVWTNSVMSQTRHSLPPRSLRLLSKFWINGTMLSMSGH